MWKKEKQGWVASAIDGYLGVVESRVVLVKSVSEEFTIYSKTIVYILERILEKIRRVSFKLLWSGGKEKDVIALIQWKNISKQKNIQGWVQKIFSSLGNHYHLRV